MNMKTNYGQLSEPEDDLELIEKILACRTELFDKLYTL